MRRFHFISGLPRSGATLLSALLRQNPRFEAGMGSPVAALFATLLDEMSDRHAFAAFIDDARRRRVLEGVMGGYYADCDAEVVFDTNRAWCAYMGVLGELAPASRVIACVRHVSWIIDSIERQVQGNALRPSPLFDYATGGTVYTRADDLARGEGIVGHAYNALKEAFFGVHASRLMLVQYETLASEPARVLAAIYEFIGEPACRHDFEHVGLDAEAFDRQAGTPGLHVVRPRVGARERQTILPPDVFARFENDAFWRDPALNTYGVRVV